VYEEEQDVQEEEEEEEEEVLEPVQPTAELHRSKLHARPTGLEAVLSSGPLAETVCSAAL
jgi:hypothetical protein